MIKKTLLALKIRGLKKTYDNKFVALKGIDLEVEQGDFFALLGANGAGKSTTIGIISSLVNKTSGKVEVFGYDLDTERERVKQQIGLVPQEFNFNIFEPILEIVINQGGYYGIDKATARKRAEELLRLLDLWDKRKEIAKNLSGGMKRRLMIARALIHSPKLLILDEPTAGVDIEIRRSMWELLTQLNNAGTTIILTTHYLEEAESLCRNIAIINQGEVVENTSMKALLSQLQTETFVLDLKDSLPSLPEIEDISVRQRDENTLEVDVDKSRSLNFLFESLDKYGIRIMSMRNKSNRLEELFMNLVQNSNGSNTDSDTNNNAKDNVSKVFRYIPKPWDLDALEGHINLALERYLDNLQSGPFYEADLDRQLQQFTEDCQHWLTYSLRAYGDVDVYKEYPNIIRLLTTAYSDLSDAIEAVNTGEIFRYINKPWNVDELLIDLQLAMSFFMLQRDRNQLIHEKLSKNCSYITMMVYNPPVWGRHLTMLLILIGTSVYAVSIILVVHVFPSKQDINRKDVEAEYNLHSHDHYLAQIAVQPRQLIFLLLKTFNFFSNSLLLTFTHTLMSMNPGQKHTTSYQKALRMFWKSIYRDGGKTLYSQQQFGPTKPEWINVEHVFPMAWVVKDLVKAKKCMDRRDCRRKSKRFNLIECDLHNLYPSRRDLNMTRGSYRFGNIKGELRLFGNYDFEIDYRARLIEPAPASPGRNSTLHVLYCRCL
ncbi:putative ABC transporter ATP-binding protein YadG [Nymphon striatum]|nr:putative ABC transporter ATP-binding protein YadG [Nymphon striatum]